MKTNRALLILLIICILACALNARPYGFFGALNGGIAWESGGIEVYPIPALFVCQGSSNMDASGNWHYYPNLLSYLLPDLVTDC